MKLILNDHVEHLGERGDSVVVKPGYARNYLLPKGLAYLDTPGNRKLFEQEQSRWEEMDLERKSAAERVAAELKGTELLFERRVGEKDVLFGSVSVLDISRGLADKGFNFERRRIRLDHPIKELGSHDVAVQIHRDVAVTVPVHVVRPGGQPEPAADEAAAGDETAFAEPDVPTETMESVDAEAPDAVADPTETDAVAG
jgi:large subunit ribosomal protein L9